ncbi:MULTISPECIES: hypothetical protein [Streptacidiphilus]|uniref:Uncharacterized protein n=1 Tax=Streptacidiphilus cavernicola TaxID=3342716 RepID=A0ABV6V0C5_9ACTN|nr:hypothetical protein [Streptacidiphilus jeojiense]
MNNQTYDRYAQKPSEKWIGHLWMATWKDKDGFYARGQIRDVAPGKLLVRWLGRRRRADEWVGLDSGTFKRSAVRDFLDSPPREGGRIG